MADAQAANTDEKLVGKDERTGNVRTPILLVVAGVLVSFGIGAVIGRQTDWSSRGLAALAGLLAGAFWAILLFVSLSRKSHTRAEFGANGLLAGLAAPAIVGILYGAATGEMRELNKQTGQYELRSAGAETKMERMIWASLYGGAAVAGWTGLVGGVAGLLFGLMVGSNYVAHHDYDAEIRRAWRRAMEESAAKAEAEREAAEAAAAAAPRAPRAAGRTRQLDARRS
jgi:hypothetical protein